MMLRAFNLVLAVGLCSFPAAVVAAEPDAVTTALLRASVEQKVSTPSERQALVQAAANYCDTLRRVYPRNSPSEDVWLKEEVAAGGDRPWRALRSAEFGRRMAANFVDACVYSAKAYQAGKDKHNSLLWLAFAFAHFRSDADYYAKKNGVDADRYALGILPGATVEALLLAAIKE